jgi:MoaA/NifB/PqqE/SkfB family radical SAM enzyme
MYKYHELKTIHIEMTERCNAACPQCGRNINGGEQNPYIKNRELTLADIRQFIPIELCKQLSNIYMCGNYGDPIVAQDTLEAFRYFREQNPDLLLSMNTNGSARSIEWWTDLAKVYGDKGYVIFSIDGLEDTNHIYRQNTIWSKIIENVSAFIQAGGKARWEYIVFRHNEHQVEEARELANTLGFEQFTVKKSARFMSLSGDIKENSIVKDRKGNTINIAPPENNEYRNDGLKKINTLNVQNINITLPTTYLEVKNKLNPELFLDTELQKEYDNADIECKVQKEKNIYISAEGIVQPCCWVASQMYPWYHSPRGTQIWKLINKIGLDNINLHKYSLAEILKGNYFDMIADSWNKPSCKEGKLNICSKVCGKSLETFSKQYS